MRRVGGQPWCSAAAGGGQALLCSLAGRQAAMHPRASLPPALTCCACSIARGNCFRRLLPRCRRRSSRRSCWQVLRGRSAHGRWRSSPPRRHGQHSAAHPPQSERGKGCAARLRVPSLPPARPPRCWLAADPAGLLCQDGHRGWLEHLALSGIVVGSVVRSALSMAPVCLQVLTTQQLTVMAAVPSSPTRHSHHSLLPCWVGWGLTNLLRIFLQHLKVQRTTSSQISLRKP